MSTSIRTLNTEGGKLISLQCYKVHGIRLTGPITTLLQIKIHPIANKNALINDSSCVIIHMIFCSVQDLSKRCSFCLNSSLYFPAHIGSHIVTSVICWKQLGALQPIRRQSTRPNLKMASVIYCMRLLLSGKLTWNKRCTQMVQFKDSIVFLSQFNELWKTINTTKCWDTLLINYLLNQRWFQMHLRQFASLTSVACGEVDEARAKPKLDLIKNTACFILKKF